jgi:phage shock protein PspC (stress-responsive transcriptional regulator)
MKKTFTINISGIIFNIDEDAFEVLNQYLSRIRDYFAKQEGGDEVFADIESRIAEHLGGRLTETKQVVTIEDISEVIATMGDTADITGEEDQGTGATGQPGKGATGQRGSKRLFRDPEQRILGGVCGGLGVYFNLDPVIFRLIFVILTFSGFGILLYLVLWIITPVAETVTDRLEMRGEPVNIKNIERSVQTEWTHVKGKINGLAAEAKDTYKRSRPVFGILLENLGRACLAVLGVIWGGFRVIFGMVLMLIGLSMVFALLVLVFGWFGPVYSDGSDMIFSLPAVVHTFIGTGVSTGLVLLTLLFFIGIPFAMLVYSGLRLAFRIRKIQYASLTAFNIWLVSIFVMLYLGFKITNNFRSDYTLTHKDPVITGLTQDTLYVALDNRLVDSLENVGISSVLRDPGLYIMEDHSILVKPILSIFPSDDSLFHLTRNVYSRGRTPEMAVKYAREVRYQYSIRDSLMVFDPVGMLPETQSWQGRKIRLRLEVPVGKVVAFDSLIYRILNTQMDPGSYELSGNKFRMTPEGLEEIR